MFAGQVMIGACVSLTVTVNEQVAMSAVQLTVVVPIGKNDPEAGEQTGLQLPVTVGAM
jgi:hypothetical protein